jgi:hypothetical protein
MRAEFEERQKSSPLGGGQVNPLQDFDPAAWLAGSSGKKSEGSGSKKIEAPAERGVSR